MIRLIVQLFIVLQLSVSFVHGSCFLDLLKTSNGTDAAGKPITQYYCDSMGMRRELNTTWTIGSPDCLECRCETFGLECCAYGFAAGLEDPPAQCQIVRTGCDAKLVLKSDPSKPCPDTDDIIETTRRIKVKLFALRRKNATLT